MTEHDEQADRVERELDDMQRRSERLAEGIDDREAAAAALRRRGA